MEKIPFYHPNLKISPSKIRQIIDLVRGKEVSHSLHILNPLPHKGARMLQKILEGSQKYFLNKQMEKDSQKAKNIDKDQKIFINEIMVGKGKRHKKTFPRAKGSADTLQTTYSHLFFFLSKVNGKEKAK